MPLIPGEIHIPARNDVRSRQYTPARADLFEIISYESRTLRKRSQSQVILQTEAHFLVRIFLPKCGGGFQIKLLRIRNYISLDSIVGG